MKKRKHLSAILLTLALALGALTGCAGTPVSTGDAGTTATPETTAAPETTEAPAAMVKTGLSISADISGSKSATAGEDGQAKFDVTLVAVTVNDKGVIESCVIDSIPATVKFSAAGAVTSDLTAAVPTKNEMGEAYGMKAYGGSKFEWNEQAAALAAYAVGKTAEELKTGAVDETGHAKDADLATTASIYLGGYVDGIEAAVKNAQHLGAQSGDVLKLATVNSLSGSKDAAVEKDGAAQLDACITAMTMNGDVISSCYIDSVQAKVAFDAAGAVTTDLTVPVQTKNALGDNYGMKAYGGAKYEWYEQAAAFAAYVTGKTPAEVAGIALNEKAAPADADLAASVTISIGDFQALIAKAAAQ